MMTHGLSLPGHCVSPRVLTQYLLGSSSDSWTSSSIPRVDRE